MNLLLSFSITLVGFTAMVSQIIFMRELLIVFYGNELSIGFILAGWLVGGAVGSYGFGRIADKIKSKFMFFAICQLAVGIIVPAGIVLIRSVRSILGVNPGEIIGLVPMLISSVIILVPLCSILGFMFPLSCRIYGQGIHNENGAVKIGKVYVFEAVGSIAGGLSASFILIPFLNSIQITGILSLLNIVSASAIALIFVEIRKRRILSAALTVSLGIIITMSCSGAWNSLNRYSVSRQWQGYNLLAAKDSIYGNIVLGERGGQFSFFENGLHLYTVPDLMAAEERVHYALLEHPDPKRVLLVGGGMGGLLEEILKHGVEKCDYVELDPLLIEIAETGLPNKYSKVIRDGRISIKNMDGRFFIKRTDAKYDVCIINVGGPQTAQLNRYYTVEFFREVKRVLNRTGVLSFALPSSDSYIKDELGRFLGSVYATLGKVFSSVIIIPGEAAIFLASDAEGFLTYDYNVLMERTLQRGLKLRYIREYYLPYKLSKERIGYTEEAVKGYVGAEINYDFRPISYYYDMVFWSSHFKDSVVTKILVSVGQRTVVTAILGVCGCVLILGLVRARRRGFLKKAVLISVAASGFGGMSFQIITLLSFQIIYGYLFYKLGFILTAFMAGLALGGWSATKMLPIIKNDIAALLWAQAAICVYPLVLPFLFIWLPGSTGEIVSWIGSNVLFILIPMIMGLAGGFHFPIASKVYLDSKFGIGRGSGVLYGTDLFGACVGAVLIPIFFIPLIGMLKTSIALVAFGFIALLLLYISFSKE